MGHLFAGELTETQKKIAVSKSSELTGTVTGSIRNENEKTNKLVSFKTWDTHLKTLTFLETRRAISSEESREMLDELSSFSSASISSDS
jgi:hypothetical protein